MSDQVTRRDALRLGLASGMTFAATGLAVSQSPRREDIVLFRTPDKVVSYQGLLSPSELQVDGGKFSDAQVEVDVEKHDEQLTIYVSATKAAPTHIMLRWKQPVSPQLLLVGDAWERSYGDLQWSEPVPDKPLPWYFLTWNGSQVSGCGVKTGAGAFCFWQVDRDGVSLWLDIRNGGLAVKLGDRQLMAAQVVTRSGKAGESPLAAARAFCKLMATRPALACRTIYGSNDWYYAYGQNSAEATLRDADLIAACAPAGAPRPFTIIDDGWRRKDAFPDMAKLSDDIRQRGTIPGIWVRPLQAEQDTPRSLLLPDQRYGIRKDRHVEVAYDPTIPEALEKAVAKVREVVGWNYDLVKHDFSTYELLGRWGFEMGASPTTQGWGFHDATLTNAEIISNLYRAIRSAAGAKTLVVGCNTVGHLAVGLFEAQRTGDDVSGRDFRRTRRMGVNTLAYRLGQNGTFFSQDADCVPITTAIAWSQTSQWLELVAKSGTACLISPAPDALGPMQKEAIKRAFETACHAPAEYGPLDWFATSTPGTWGTRGNTKHFDWYAEQPGWPFEL